MNKNNFVLAIIVLSAVCLSCTFLKGLSGNSAYGVGEIGKESFPALDPNASFPAISTDMIDALITDIPELSKHRDEMLDAEREAINGLLADMREEPRAAQTYLPSRPEEPAETYYRSITNLAGDIKLIPAAYAAEPDLSGLGGLQQYLIGHQIGYFSVDAGSIGKGDRGKSKTVEMKDEKTGEVQASMIISVADDGSVSTELTTKISMAIFGLDANSKVKVTGNMCPDSEGKVDLAIEQNSNGRAGSSGSVIYDKNLSAKIKVSVNDDAEVAGMDVDFKQATRSTAGGRQVYVETRQSGHGTTGTYSEMKFDDARLERSSSQATADDSALSRAGLTDAFRIAIGFLESAKGRWQGGGCVKIDATSPGTVAVNSSTQIPVKVMHKFDGTEVPSKLTVELSGGASIDPTLIPKTAGTLNYVAPGERGKSATIKLTANSRRGRATSDLTASTEGNSYRVNGSSQGAKFTGEICSLNGQFYLTVDAITGSWPMDFTPNPGDGLSGEMTGTFEANGCTLSGGGPYSVKLNADGSGTITFTYNSTATCPAGTRTTSKTTTIPLTPAPDLKCN
ncbi:MAG: hypothetical protein DMF63_03910 [Acidobacteria bacterium]|nr:MAG: hypothetical protein DMF63_03910 [Acidobacteriota bacterium]